MSLKLSVSEAFKFLLSTGNFLPKDLLHHLTGAAQPANPEPEPAPAAAGPAPASADGSHPDVKG